MSDAIIYLTMTLSLLGGALLILHRRLLAWLGARSLYNLWVILPLSGVMMLLAMWLPAQLYQALSGWLGGTEPALFTVFSGVSSQLSRLSEQVSTSVVINLLSLVWLVGVVGMWWLFWRDYQRTKVRHYYRNQGLNVSRSKHFTPSIAGFFTPTLRLPVDFVKQFNKAERELIIAHELMHWRRGDMQANVLAWLLLSLQWFNPLAWKCYTRFRADQELACDADVLVQHAHPARYANALLKASVGHSATPTAKGFRAILSFAPCSTHYIHQQRNVTMLKERITQLNKPSPKRYTPLVSACLLMLVTTLIWQLPAAATQASQAEAQTADLAQDITPIVRINPSYPAEAAAAGIEGFVEVSFVVNARGETEQVQVLRSQPENTFDDAVIAAVKRWRYAPQATPNSQTVRIEMKL